MKTASLLCAAVALTALVTPTRADDGDVNYTCEKGAIQGYNDLVWKGDTNELVYVRGNDNINLQNVRHDAGTWSGKVDNENTTVKFDVKSAVMTVTTNGKALSYKCKKA